MINITTDELEEIMEISEIEDAIAANEITAAAVFTQMRQHINAVKKDAERYQYIKKNYVWHRYGRISDHDCYAIAGCRLPYFANLSCSSMLDDNIDRMIRG